MQHGEVGPETENEEMCVTENAGEQVENERSNKGLDGVHYEKLQAHPDYKLSEEEQMVSVDGRDTES